MKRLCLERWSAQLLSARTRPCCLRRPPQNLIQRNSTCMQMQSTSAVSYNEMTYEDGELSEVQTIPAFPSPPPSASLRSAKLAALHARLSLPRKLPLQILARTLVTPSADPDPDFNNASLAQLGEHLLAYHVSEYLICTYPRLPMAILYASTFAYNGPATLSRIAQEWGVNSAFAPGSEVDPGLLQFAKMDPGSEMPGGKTTRSDAPGFRRGISSRVVYDDEFGDVIRKKTTITDPQTTANAYASFVRALIGSIYLHVGRSAVKTFVKQHILSRYLDMSTLFQFSQPVRDLARLCAREDFEPPIARILSETGRNSISPVFVVGIYSGREKLGEAAGASLDDARIRASVASLKAWYLYSPGPDVNVPSDTEMPGAEGQKPFESVHVDIGEIVA